MPFLPLAAGLSLVALCVVIHAGVIAFLLHRFRQLGMASEIRVLSSTWILVRIAWWTVLAHLLEIGVWGVAYRVLGILPDLDTALYFSGVTYTTVGYGDVLIPPPWHTMAVLEGLSGILMAGWSTAFLFAILNHLFAHARRIVSTPRGGME